MRGARETVFFFYKESKSNSFSFLGGVGWGWGKLDGQTNRPKQISPVNFFDIGGITMHKSISYSPDNFNL